MKISIKGYCLLFVCSWLLPLCAFAQTEVSPSPDTLKENLEGSLVTASAGPSAVLASVPVHVMERSTIERSGVSGVADALKGMAGVSVRDYGGIGGLKTVSIRNLGAQHTAVAYDGITVSNLQSGQVDVSLFPLENVERISLFIGQGDDIFCFARLYASSGALVIRTMAPQFVDGKGTNLQVQMTAASFGTWNPALRLEQRLGERWSMNVTGDYLHSEGNYPYKIQNGTTVEERIRTNSDVNRVRSEFNLYGNVGMCGKIGVKGSFLWSERGLPGSVILYNVDKAERLWDRNAFAQVTYEDKFGEKWEFKGALKFSSAYNRYLIESKLYKEGFQEDEYLQNEYYSTAALLFRPSDCWSFSIAQDIFCNTLWSDIPECPYPSRFTSMTALSGQYRNSRLTATASLLGTFISEKVEKGESADDRRHLSPSVALSYKLFSDCNLRVRASYKNVFRTPTFNDLYYSRVGNCNLKSERADQFNGGLVWSGASGILKYGSFTADGYYNMVRDKIVAIPTMFVWKMMNVGRVRMVGVDVGAQAKIGLGQRMDLSVAGSWSYQYAVDISDPQAKNYGDQIPYAPRNSGAVSVIWCNPWVNVSYRMTAVGERYALSQNVERNLVEAYCEHSISFSHEFVMKRAKLRLQGDIVNLTDVNYQVVQYYPMPGRSYRIGARLVL